MKIRFRNIGRLKAIILILAVGLMFWSKTLAFVNHEVKRGETLWGIAHHYGVSPDDIVELNPSIKNGLKNGITIKIPEKNDLEKNPVQSFSENETEFVNHDVELSQEETPDKDVKQEDLQLSQPLTYPSSLEAPDVQHNSSTGADTYIARFGDTFKSVESKTGVSEVTLSNLNPMVDGEKIQESEVIRLKSSAPHSTLRNILSTVDSIVYNVIPKDTQPISKKKEIGLALMLPFELSQDEISRQALLATEFYKGFLISTKEIGNNIDYELKIYAIDTSDESVSLEKKIERLTEEGVNVVIPPDDDVQIEEIEELCDANGITVFNVLNIKDDGYQSYSNVLQCNINQKMMYEKAIQALMAYYSDYQPIILNQIGGKEEKSGFTQELQRQYQQRGIKVDEITFIDNLKESDLNDLASDKKYIFIPKSGSQDVFEKIYETIAWLKESDVDPERIKLFGYPDWVAFRGQTEEELHRLGAVIYSRFNYDSSGRTTGEMNELFMQWYGSPLIEVFPSQGLLGYDAGKVLYDLLSYNWPKHPSILNTRAYTGKQSSFRFVKNESEGVINDTLYIIEFKPGSATHSKVM